MAYYYSWSCLIETHGGAPELLLYVDLSANFLASSPQSWRHLWHRPVVPEGAGDAWHPHIWVDQLTLFQPEGAEYAHHITVSTPGFENLTTSLHKVHSEKVTKFCEISTFLLTRVLTHSQKSKVEVSQKDLRQKMTPLKIRDVLTKS